MTKIEITVSAKQYEDCDDCLAAAAADVAADRGLAGHDLEPRWASDERDEIALTVPARDSDEIESADGESYTFGAWLAAAGRSDSASEYDLRAAWAAGEDPAEYAA